MQTLIALPDDDAKAMIEALFAEGGTWYYSTIAEKLVLPLEQVVKLCEELRDEGKIK